MSQSLKQKKFHFGQLSLKLVVVWMMEMEWNHHGETVKWKPMENDTAWKLH